MVQKIKCECAERYETEINSYALFEEIKNFFESQVNEQIYDDIAVEIPFYVGHSEVQAIKWYASKWYTCRACGCMWEFNYPDFPTQGFVRKFEDGHYRPK